jgi:hypothetical protein
LVQKKINKEKKIKWTLFHTGDKEKYCVLINKYEPDKIKKYTLRIKIRVLKATSQGVQ